MSPSNVRVPASVCCSHPPARFSTARRTSTTNRDPPHPLSVYGKTKAEAERVIQKIVPDAAIVRLSLVLGYSPHSVERMPCSISSKPAIRQGNRHRIAPGGRISQRDRCRTLTQWILELALSRKQAASSISAPPMRCRDSRLSPLGGGHGLRERSGHRAGCAAPDRAPRGRRHLLVPARIREFSSVPVPSCMQAIERCVMSLSTSLPKAVHELEFSHGSIYGPEEAAAVAACSGRFSAVVRPPRQEFRNSLRRVLWGPLRSRRHLGYSRTRPRARRRRRRSRRRGHHHADHLDLHRECRREARREGGLRRR